MESGLSTTAVRASPCSGNTLVKGCCFCAPEPNAAGGGAEADVIGGIGMGLG
jgi:hypothetical protein